MTEQQGLILTGLDGSNPLAFLAALGTLRTLTHALPDQEVRMRWVQHAGAWRPEISAAVSIEDTGLLGTLQEALAVAPAEHPLYRVLTSEQENSAWTGTDSYWFTALASDIATEATSQLQTVRRDYFVGNVKSIIEATTREHLVRSLFKPWDYADALDNQSLHFDPSEDRRHAYQWAKPSGDPARKREGGMLGANRLAMEAWPLFQAVARGDRLQTRGFRGTRANNTRWTWPIWSAPISEQLVASVLALETLQSDALDGEELHSQGIAAAYRCKRILVGKTPNFTPAKAIL